MVVDFVGIGSGKCGSTWLYKNIVKHPQVCDKNAKELNYFATDYLYYKKDHEWYLSNFSGCESNKIKGEFSVVYLYDNAAAQRIFKALPNVKIIAILRDPIERTYSDYFHAIRKGDVSPNSSFGDYISKPENLEYGLYGKYLKKFYDTFDRDNLKVLLLEELRDEPEKGIRSVYEFIGVDADYLPPDLHSRVNEATFYKLIFVENIMTRVSRALNRMGYIKVVELLKRIGLPAAVRWMNRKSANKPPMCEDDRNYLRAYYAESNDYLRETLSVSISKYWTTV